MSTMIKHGNDIIRINPQTKRKLEYSTDAGRNWHSLHSSSEGFIELMSYNSEILALTTRGLYYSNDNGRNWHRRN